MQDSNAAAITTLLVDDHAVVRLGISQALDAREDISIVGTAGSGEEAIEQARSLHPNVILMDFTMPGMNGLEAMRRIHEIDTSIKVIIFTANANRKNARNAIDAGAMGFLSKSVDTDTLAEAVKAVQSGECFLDPEMLQQITTTDEDSARFHSLSDQENEVAMLLASGESTSGIVDIMKLDATDVYRIRASILEKLGLKNSVELAHFMLGRGELDPRQ